MLHIYVGRLDGLMNDPSSFFDNQFDPEWFADPFVKRIAKDIDDTDVVSAYQMNNPIWGPTNCKLLSTGAKNLILAYKTDNLIYATRMGDNCSNLLLEIAEQKELTVCLTHIMHFTRDFTAHIINTNTMTSTYAEYVIALCDLLP